MKARFLIPTLLATALLAACNNAPNPPAPPSPPNTPQTMMGKAVGNAIDQARKELATSNLELGRDGGISINGNRIGEGNQPKAEITPQGDFLIEGNAVAVDDDQRALLLDYRRQVHGMAGTGMAMGVKGADLASTAITEAIGGIFKGDGQQIEQRIEAEAKKLEAEAKQLCTQLTPLLATQSKLAATLPEFQPYATLTQDDINDCGKHDGASVIGNGGKQVQAQIRDDIRRSIQTAVQSSVGDAAGGTVNVDGVRFLVPGGNLSVDSNGTARTLNVEGAVNVRLQGGQMQINDKIYARPAKGSVVDVRDLDHVTVDGRTTIAK